MRGNLGVAGSFLGRLFLDGQRWYCIPGKWMLEKDHFLPIHINLLGIFTHCSDDALFDVVLIVEAG